MATLMESLAVVTSGPELIAGSKPIRRNKNGNDRPKDVEIMMAENIAIPNAIANRNCSLGSNRFSVADKIPDFVLETGESDSDSVEDASTALATEEWFAKNEGKNEQILPPITPQQRAIKRAIRTSRINTWLILRAARSPVASPQTTIADV